MLINLRNNVYYTHTCSFTHEIREKRIHFSLFFFLFFSSSSFSYPHFSIMLPPNETIPMGSLTTIEKEWKDEIPPSLEVYLDTKPTYGLTDDQVSERLTKFGRNELEEKKRSKIKHFLTFCTHIESMYEINNSIEHVHSYRCYCLSHGNIHHPDRCNQGLG